MKQTDADVRELIEKYRLLAGIVYPRLQEGLETETHPLIHIQYRIKTMDSIKEKMIRKPDLYSSIYDITDILGFRVICYFQDDVEKAAEELAKILRVDWSRSKDKRKLIDPRSFGYLSLHYICALPEEEELSDLWFEIQIKTILQHSWAEIEHDLGYKTEIEVPREIRRSFSKAASLLETTDDIFSDIKRKLEEYTSRVKSNIESDHLDDIYFDRLSLAEYTAHNNTYLKLLNEIAAITNAHITEGITDNQLPLIDFLGIKTLGDMSRMIEKEYDLALNLAKTALKDSDLDELSSTVAYYYLFRAMLISSNMSRERISEFFALSSKNQKSIERNTEKILKERQKL